MSCHRPNKNAATNRRPAFRATLAWNSRVRRALHRRSRAPVAELGSLAIMKRRWPVLILIAGAGVFGLIVLQLTRVPQSPSVSFLGYTNQSGITLASFRVQNGNRGTVTVCADIILWN